MLRRLSIPVCLALVIGCGEPTGAPPHNPLAPSALESIGTDSTTGATIETDKDDYAPGEIVHLTGHGWAAGETVHLHMTEEPDTHGPVDQDVVADSAGAFSLHFYDVQEHDLGSLFTLTATGQTSGSVATLTFTDGTITEATITMTASPGCVVPTASVATGTPICAAAAFTINPSGATNAQFRWVSPSGSVAISQTQFGPGVTGDQTYSASYTPTEVGSWTVRLCQSNSGSTSQTTCPSSSEKATATFTVTAANVATTTSVTSSANPSVTGQSVTFTAAVTAGATTVTTGTVDFRLGGTDCTTGTVFASGVSLASGSAQANRTFNATETGAVIRACYSGATGYNASDGTVTQDVNKATTQTALTSGPTDPTNAGAPVTWTATVTVDAPGAGSPTGTVTLYEFAGSETCSAPGSATVIASAAVGLPIGPVTTLSAGNHSLTACYGGDANFAGSSGTDTHSVQLIASTTLLTSSANPSVTGQSVTFTATVTHSGGSVGANGTVTFHANTCAGATLAGPTPLDGSGQATYGPNTYQASGGSVTVAACYSGTAIYAASDDDLEQAVNKAGTTLTLGTNDPSIYFGESVTFTATVAVTSPGAGTPSGNVNFHESGTCISPGTLIGTDALSGGTASVTTTSLNAGTYTILACYVGDLDVYGSGDTESQEVLKATTALTLSTSGSPSYYGNSVTFTATLAVTNGVATLTGGTVNVSNGGTCNANGTITGGTSLGSDAIAGLTASVSTSSLGAATHTIVACYGGNSNVAGSGDDVQQVVNPAVTQTTLSSSPDPSVFGDAVTFTATVSVTQGAGSPVGTVDFYEGTSCSGTSIGSAAVSGGSASINGTYAFLTAGGSPHDLIACFSGSTNFGPSDGGDTHSVTPAATTVTASVSPTAVQYSDKVTFSATVSPTSLNGQTLSGNVQFKLNGANVGSTQAVSGGSASLADYQVTLPGGNPGPTSYSVEAVFTSTNVNFQDGSDTDQLSVAREDATLGYDAANPAAIQVASAGGTANVSLKVTVVETNTSGTEPNGTTTAPGDITNAPVSVALQSIVGGGSNTMSCSPTSLSAGTYPVRTFTCTATNVAPNTFEVQVSSNGTYYVAAPLTEVLTVFDPSLGFTTGGGWFYWPGTMEKTNFGFTIKYNKSGTNPQGNLLVIRHKPDGSIQRFKSNALSGLALSPLNSYPGYATFSGKGNYNETGWTSSIQTTFSAYVEDGNNPGTGPDKFWVAVAGYPPLLLPGPAASNAVVINGGNIQVPHTRSK